MKPMFRSLPRITIALILAGACQNQGDEPLAAPLQTVREIRALTQEQVSKHPAVSLHGIITYSEPDWYLTFFADETGGIYLGTTTSSRFAPGDRVQVTGVAAAGRSAAIVTGTDQPQPQIRVLEHGSLPPAKDASPEHLANAIYDAEWITVRGVVKAVTRVNDRASLDLNLGTQTFEALLCGYPNGRELPEYLEGVPIVAQGVLGTFSDQRGTISRTVLYVPSVRQCEPDPAYLDAQFQMPVQQYSELFSLPKSSNGSRLHVQGQVCLAKPEHGFFMRLQESGILTGSLWVQTTQPIPLEPGQMVDVLGKVELSNRRPLLKDAIVRSLGRKPLPEPRKPNLDEMASGDYNGSFISLDGTLIAQQTGLEEESLILVAGQHAFPARLDRSNEDRRLPQFQQGSHVRLTGVCVLPSQQALGSGASPFQFQIWLRGPEDVTLLAVPPWWTLKRVLAALAATAILAAAAFLWVFALRRRVAMQTRLIGEHVARQTLQDERVRIAREFHDTFEQHLVGLGLTLQAAEAEMDEPEKVQELLREAAEMTRHTREEAKHAIWELRTGALLASDAAALIREELGPSAQAAQVKLQVEVEGPQRPLPAVVQNHLLRIAQEGFTNALKHARPKSVTIRLLFEEEEVRLLVLDDGAGFDAAAAAAAGRFGLAGMRERAVRMKGGFEIESAPGKGTQVQVRVPLEVCS